MKQTLQKTGRVIFALPSLLAIGLVVIYQWTLSPLIGRNCRFYPTCSHYMIAAIKKYGLMRGVARGTWRICRCHPWNPGGIDFP